MRKPKMTMRDYYKDGVCPDCLEPITDDCVTGDACKRCGHVFISTAPAFRHDTRGEYLGHYLGHDVYIVDDSILARYGNEPHAYGSMMMSVLFRSAAPGHHGERVGLSDGRTVTWPQFIFEEGATPFHQAVILAILDCAPRWYKELELQRINR